MISMTAAATRSATWTVAYRNPRANRFLRVALELTWQEAYDLAAKLCEARPELQVYYVTSAAYEASEAVRLPADVAAGRMSQDLADRYLEDHGNVLVEATGRRVRILEGGTLPDAVAAWLDQQRYANRLGDLVAADQAIPQAAYDAAARGEFARALAFLRDDVRPALVGADAEAAERQVVAWFSRHMVELRTDPTRDAYATLAYRAADHAEALADDAARAKTLTTVAHPARPLRWHKDDSYVSRLIAFAVTPMWDMIVTRERTLAGGLAYAVYARPTSGTFGRVLVGHRSLQRHAKTLAAEWAQQARADYAEAKHARTEAVDAPSYAATVARCRWDANVLKGQRAQALDGAEAEAYEEAWQRAHPAPVVSVDPGRTTGYAVWGLPRADGSHAPWGLPNRPTS